MKTINKLVLWFITLLSITWVNAEYRVYDNVWDFEKAKGDVCEAATDGCNNYFMTNGKVTWGTLMACPEEQKIEWTCTKYKENVMTTKMIETDTFVENFTAPESKLSDNDQNFYNTIRDRLDMKYQNIIDKIVNRIDEKLSKYSETKRERIKLIISEKIEAKISHLLLQYPQDIALPTAVNNKYLTYTLLKFELIK